MSIIVLAALIIHAVVVVVGTRFLWAKHFAKGHHPHVVASVTAASTLFLILHGLNYWRGTHPAVEWQAMSLFNGELYLALICAYRSQRATNDERVPNTAR